jgi:hypothetical protein
MSSMPARAAVATRSELNLKHGPGGTFNGMMILLDDMTEVSDLPDCDRRNTNLNA